MGMDRQTKHVAAHSFCNREISAAIAQVPVNRLQMQRHGIMHGGADPGRDKPFQNPVAVLYSNGINMIYVFSVTGHHGQPDAWNIAEVIVIHPGHADPSLIPSIKVTQFGIQKNRLHGIQAGIESNGPMHVFRYAAVITKLPQTFIQLPFVRGYQPGISERAEILGRIKTEGADKIGRASCRERV